MKNIIKVLFSIMGAMALIFTFVSPTIASAAASPRWVPVYKVYNPNSGEHLLTPNKAESEQLAKIGWKAEGEAYRAATSVEAQLKVYRLYNPNSGGHFYTADFNEFKHLLSLGWKDDKYIIPAQNDGGIYTKPVYRMYNPNERRAGTHHFTINEAEVDALKKAGWRYEGIAWYALNRIK